MPSHWHRIEAASRSVPLRDGLAARVADPLWALARQHQVGEFRGDDAAQPAAIRLNGRIVPLQTFMGAEAEGEGPRPLPQQPLEKVVEQFTEPQSGGGSLHASVRAGGRLVRLLRGAGYGVAASALTEAYHPEGPAGDVVTDGRRGRVAVELLSGRGLDGFRLAAEPASTIRKLVDQVLQAEGFGQHDIDAAVEIINDWRPWAATRGGNVPEAGTWNDQRLEHRFSLAAAATDGEVALEAPEHWGGHLDWHSFDLVAGGAHKLEKPRQQKLEATHLPSSVRYAGMPASRWWEFEDNAVHFGDLEAGPADLARLLVAEFATVYGDDWFVVPVRVPVSSLVEVAEVAIIDNFDQDITIGSLAKRDHDRLGDARPWRFLELTNDKLSDSHPSPWLLVPPSLLNSLEGPALERVVFSRDEGANLAWGIERQVEGPLGRGVDRAQAWAVAHPPVDDGGGTGHPDDEKGPIGGDEEYWRYRLESTAPPWWIPLVPERISSRSEQVKLRRSRMLHWDRLAGVGVGPQSNVLDPTRPVWLREEEVPKSGIRMERRWQLARWHDGSVHLWLQRRKRPGRGEASSGLRWDLLEDPEQQP